MWNLAKILSLLLLFFLFAAPSTAEIKSVKIRSDDRGQILLDYFQFTNTGHVSIAVSSVSLNSLPVTSNISRPDPSRFGFYLLSEEAASYVRFYEGDISCALDSKYISLLFTFQDLPHPPQFSFNKSYPVTYPNEYSLYFANCNPLTHVTMDVRTELYNIDNGTTKDYLSAGITKLPCLYLVFSIIYLIFLGVWIFACLKNRKSFHMVHLLMGLLLVMKAIYLLCEAEVQQSVKVRGTPTRVWDELFYIFHFITPALLYTVMVVIFDGWSFLKPKTKMVLMIVIPLHGLATVLSKETGVVSFRSDIRSSGYWLMMVETVCHALITIPVLISLILVCKPYGTERAAMKQYPAKFALFWGLSIVVVVYLLIDLILGLGINRLSYDYHWESNVAEQIISLLFHIVMYFMFRQFEEHEYFVQLNVV